MFSSSSNVFTGEEMSPWDFQEEETLEELETIERQLYAELCQVRLKIANKKVEAATIEYRKSLEGVIYG